MNDADAWGVSATTLAAHSGFTDLVLFLLDKGADPNAAPNGFTALHEAIMRRDEKMVAALLDHHADPNTPLKTFTPTRRSSDDFHFEPALVGATPYWLAARFTEPDIMRLLVKHGADPLFVHHADWVAEQGFGGVAAQRDRERADGGDGNAPRESRGSSWSARSASRRRSKPSNSRSSWGPTSISPIPTAAPRWTPPRPCGTSRWSTFWSRRAPRRALLSAWLAVAVAADEGRETQR